LNRLPRVKAFINHHAPLYPNVEVRYIGGADPELVFVRDDETDGERIPVDDLSTEEICELLEKRGIMKNASEEGEEEDEEEDPGMEFEEEHGGIPGHHDGHAGAPAPHHDEAEL